MRGLDVPGTTRARNRLSIRWDRSVKHVLGTRLSSSARVIRISILVQGGALRAPREPICPMQPQALARGVRPPAGPRAARGCESRRDPACRYFDELRKAALAGRAGLRDGRAWSPRLRSWGVQRGRAPSRQPPGGLSRRRRRASLGRQRPAYIKVALRRRRDRALPGRRDGASIFAVV